MASSLTETKAALIAANRLLQEVEARLQDAMPSHANDIDAWLSTGIQQVEDDLSGLVEKVRALVGQI